MRPFACAVLLSTALLSTGCLYRAEVQQGNVMEQRQIDQLKPGMNKRQVALLLGTPAIQSPFNTDRWDYIYTLRQKGREVERKSMSLLFKDDQLIRISGDYKPNVVAE
jgi:outer membrane protein assembly factor BamE